MSRKDDLEFISVNQNEDDFSMNSANRMQYDDTTDSVIGNTFLKFSKVFLLSKYGFICLIYFFYN